MAVGAGLAIGGLLSAGGAIGGAFASQPRTGGSGSSIIPSFDPQLDFGLNAAALDALGRIGFFNPQVLQSTGPMSRLINQINANTADEKVKRRALQELQTLIDRGQIGPDGKIQVFGDNLGAAGFYDDRNQQRFPEELSGALARIGVSTDDLAGLLQQERDFQEKLKPLLGLGPFQENVILDRLNAAAQVSQAANGLLTGQSSPLQDTIRNQFLRDRTRGIDQAEETLLLRGKHGGFNPSTGLERIAEMRSDLNTDAELASIERSLLYAGGVNDLLAPGTAAAQGQAGLSNSASLGALGIASQQAQAANALNTQSAIVGANNLGTGISAAATGLGDVISAYSLFGGNNAPAAVNSVASNAVNSGAGLQFGAF